MSMKRPKASSSGSSSSNNVNDVGEDLKRQVKEWMRMMGPVRVMTDEQIEELRLQISLFGAISEQLIEMHMSMTARGDAIAGTSLGSQYCDPQMIHGSAPKITTKPRWSPSDVQLAALETKFAEGNVAPNKQRIKEITSELLQHGQITEANVYNWFQNKRARSRRRQAAAAKRLSMNSEAEMEKECSKISMCQSREGSSEVRPMQSDSMKTSPSVSYMSDDRNQSIVTGASGGIKLLSAWKTDTGCLGDALLRISDDAS